MLVADLLCAVRCDPEPHRVVLWLGCNVLRTSHMARTIVAIRIDYSKKTAFTLGAVKTNFGRFPLNEKLRFLTRAAVRHVIG